MPAHKVGYFYEQDALENFGLAYLYGLSEVLNANEVFDEFGNDLGWVLDEARHAAVMAHIGSSVASARSEDALAYGVLLARLTDIATALDFTSARVTASTIATDLARALDAVLDWQPGAPIDDEAFDVVQCIDSLADSIRALITIDGGEDLAKSFDALVDSIRQLEVFFDSWVDVARATDAVLSVVHVPGAQAELAFGDPITATRNEVIVATRNDLLVARRG